MDTYHLKPTSKHNEYIWTRAESTCNPTMNTHMAHNRQISSTPEPQVRAGEYSILWAARARDSKRNTRATDSSRTVAVPDPHVSTGKYTATGAKRARDPTCQNVGG